MLFMGEEWGAQTPFFYFVDHGDPALHRAVRRGRMREFSEFGWPDRHAPDPADESTLCASRLDRSECTSQAGRRLQSWYAELIRLRRTRLSQNDEGATVEVMASEDGDWLEMRRGEVSVVVDFGSRGRHIDPSRGRVLLDSRDTGEMDRGSAGPFVVVLERETGPAPSS